MENIKIYEFIKSEIAIDTKEADNASDIIVKRYQDTNLKVNIDFSGIKSLISPFMRALLRPLVSNNINFEWVKFDNERLYETYKRILNELKVLWIENIRELHN